MTEQLPRLRPFEWILTAAVGLLGTFILFDAHAGINGAIWVACAVIVTLLCRRSQGLRATDPPALLGLAAVIAAGAAARTTDVPVHAGIAWLTAFLLGAFLSSVLVEDWEEIGLAKLVTSPFLSAARVATSSVREMGSALRVATDSPSRLILRRTLLVAPVVIVLLILLGGADPIIQSAIDKFGLWLPKMTLPPERAVFFTFLFLVMLGACSRLPELKFAFPARATPFSSGLSAKDATILVGSTLATLVLFLVLQVTYLFVQPPSQIGNGITYAEYARRGFGQLCVVVTIVAAVIVFAEKFRNAGAGDSRSLRRLELGSLAAAGLILISALRRVTLYEHAYGYTVARVHATTYIVFMAGVLALLTVELRGGRITGRLTRRSAGLALALLLAILYWNDRAWIMDRNIDRIHTTGKFDADYAARLSGDALAVLVARRAELPPDAWARIEKENSCNRFKGPFAWYEWNPMRDAASAAADALQSGAFAKCSVQSS